MNEEKQDIIFPLLFFIPFPPHPMYHTSSKIKFIPNRTETETETETDRNVLISFHLIPTHHPPTPQMFSPSEPDTAWHGACLALAELCRRGLLLPGTLGGAAPLVAKALAYDVRCGPILTRVHTESFGVPSPSLSPSFSDL